ncbi:MAG: hypothetical protein IJY99_01210 [Alphaproteobacteria bacterium]|nr:hypothetical protein [Alphaproteobacteria bacterium]
MRRFYFIGIISVLFATCDAWGDTVIDSVLCPTIMSGSNGIFEPCETGSTTYDASCYDMGSNTTSCCRNLTVQGDLDVTLTGNEYGIVTVYGDPRMTTTRTQNTTGCTITCSCVAGETSYACVKNKYGSPTSATDANACQNCPPNSVTASHGAQSITECYLPAGTEYTDATGTYTYTEDCYYE